MKKILFLFLVFFVSTLFSASFLMPDEAFKPSAILNDKGQIVVDVKLGEGIYLYEKEFKVSLKDSKNIAILKTALPQSVDHDGDKVYLVSPHVVVDLKKNTGVSGVQKIDFVLAFQGCSNKGLCYEPQTHTYSFNLDTAKLEDKTASKTVATTKEPELKKEPQTKQVEASPSEINNTVTKEMPKSVQTAPVATPAVSETQSIADTLKSGNLVLILGMFFLFGLLLSLTPCVFPMIPIISSVIVAQGDGLTTKRAFFLSIVYVLSMSVAYTFAGVLAGLFGSNLQAALQTPWVIYSFAGIFVALSLSMFDLYELQMPNFIQSKLSSATGKKSGVIGVAIMGFLSALIVGPCVAAPLAGALVYIGQTGNALLGGAALFMLSIGMGIPLIIVGTGAGKFMPRPGIWMDTVKTIFGVMMLGVAVWMVSRVLDEGLVMLLWGALAIGTGVHFGALEPLHVSDGVKENSIKKVVAVLLTLYGVILFIGSLSGSTSVETPLDQFTQKRAIEASSQKAEGLNFKVVTTQAELSTELENAKGKKVILDFAAEWCAACKELDATTFKNKDVIAKMNEFVLIRVDITANTEAQKAISKHYGVFGPPVIIFIDKDGKVLQNATITGYKEPTEFLKLLGNL
jgi:thiol:disulfide interchange protein DsbD